jgi:hypothetical protein
VSGDRVRGIDGDLIVGRVAVLDTEVVLVKIDVQVRVDQAVLDELPDDAGHFIAIKLDNGSYHLDLGHRQPLGFGHAHSRLSALQPTKAPESSWP